MDYRQWQATMYCHFGQKWAKLHYGPLWSVSPTESDRDSQQCYENTQKVCTSNDNWVYIAVKSLLQQYKFQALTNIPGVSKRALRRDIASSSISLDVQIQVWLLISSWF